MLFGLSHVYHSLSFSFMTSVQEISYGTSRRRLKKESNLSFYSPPRAVIHRTAERTVLWTNLVDASQGAFGVVWNIDFLNVNLEI